MNSNEPTVEAETLKVDTTPMFWNRMLRFSIYFTILGVGLGFILGQLITSNIRDAHAQNAQQVSPGVIIEQVDKEGIPLETQEDINPADFGIVQPETKAKEAQAVADKVQTYAIFVYVVPFLFLGMISIMVCLIMGKRERIIRQKSAEAARAEISAKASQ